MTALRIVALWFLIAVPVAVVVGRRLAIASTDTGGLPTSAGAVDGVAGATPPGSAAAAPTSEQNRSPARTEGPAEGATAIARTEGT